VATEALAEQLNGEVNRKQKTDEF